MIRHALVGGAAVVSSALVLVNCTKLDATATSDASAEASVTAVAPPSASAVVDAAAPDAAAHVTAKKPAEKLEPYCRAKNEAGLLELDLAWTQNSAVGTLKVDGKSQQVEAVMWKGSTLVNPLHKPDNQFRIATVTDDGSAKKQIQLGDYKQPWLDCL